METRERSRRNEHPSNAQSSSTPQSSRTDNPPIMMDEGLREEEIELKYGAEHVVKLFVPVSLCMLVVVATISNVNFYSLKDMYLIYTPFNETSTDTFTKSWNAVANSLILISVVIIMTMVLIGLYKKRCYMIITAWLIFSTLMLMFLFAYLFFEEVLRAYNIPMDVFTILMFNWNFGVTGMICIHWKGPLRVQQAYLIFVAALMALIFIKYLPEWTTWVVLFCVSIWDLVAVLTPRGPLLVLVKTAQERNEPIFPSLIYSAVAYKSVIMTTTHNQSEPVEGNSSPSTGTSDIGGESSQQSDNGNQSDNAREDTQHSDIEELNQVVRRFHRNVAEDMRQRLSEDGNRNVQQQSVVMEDQGVKLGLGDFIFYSVLVGKASADGDWNTTLACFVAILIGLCLTLLLLASWKKPLPALPISIAFGLMFYFLTKGIVKPFADLLASNQIFI